jgi:hypothetical protein
VIPDRFAAVDHLHSRRLDARPRVWSAAVMLAALTAACAGTPAGPRVIQVRDLPSRPAYDATWVQNDRAAAAVAMAVMERELRLPRLDVALHFYPNRQSFQDALLTVGYDPAFAQQTASRMDAIGGYRRVLLNGEVLSRAEGSAKAALFAHELTHSLQYELGGGTRGTSAQWLREGFADWVAARVLEALGVQSLETFRDRRLSLVRSSRMALALDRMVTFPEWVEMATRTDAAAIAAQAFLAVDFLVERRGMPAVLDYFSRFAASSDADANFSLAFGEPPHAFERALESHLKNAR